MDPDLDVQAATGALLGTAGDLLARLDMYKKYPYKSCLLCKLWYPDSYISNIAAFLNEPAENLDTGFSLRLQQLAGANPAAAMAWLCSEPVQELLGCTMFTFSAHSLAAERKAAEVVGLAAPFPSHRLAAFP